MTTKKDIWKQWTDRYIDAESPVPLFETDETLTVAYKHYGQNDRRILKRSTKMEEAIRDEGRKVINDWSTTDDTYDGLIYLMYWIDGGEIVPLYVGKAGKYGRDNESLSANLKDLRGSSTRKFARWGDAHYYHIGNLSAVVFNHDKTRNRSTGSGPTGCSRTVGHFANRHISGRRRGKKTTWGYTTTSKCHLENSNTRLSG